MKDRDQVQVLGEIDQRQMPAQPQRQGAEDQRNQVEQPVLSVHARANLRWRARPRYSLDALAGCLKTAAAPTCFVGVPPGVLTYCLVTASYAPRARPHRASHLGLLATFLNTLPVRSFVGR